MQAGKAVLPEMLNNLNKQNVKTETWACRAIDTGHSFIFQERPLIRKMQPMKIIIEKHPDGYVAYPIDVKGIVVGEGDTYEETLVDVKSAINFHQETFGFKDP